MCEVPVDEYQVKSVVTGIFKQKENGTLQPIVNRKKRKIVFAPYSLLTAEQKFAKSRELVAEHKTSGSKQKINQIIEDWDFDTNGKITVRGVVKIGKMGNNTVQKYWSEFKEHVAELNKNRGHVQPLPEATEQSKHKDDNALLLTNKVLPEPLNEVAYNFNDAGFNLAGLTMFLNATNALTDDDLVNLVLSIEESYHEKPVGEISIFAGGLTYRFINDINSALVKFNGFD